METLEPDEVLLCLENMTTYHESVVLFPELQA